MNHIEQFEFNVSAENSAQALNDDALMSLVQGKVLPIVDQVLNELSEPESKFKIDNLNLDLGEFSSQDVDTKLPSTLYRLLRQLILEHLYHTKADMTPLESHWLDHIFTKKSTSQALKLWQAFATEISANDRDYLQTLLMDQDNCKFVARHFTDNMVFDVIRVLEMQNANFIILLIQSHGVFSVNDDHRMLPNCESNFASNIRSRKDPQDAIKRGITSVASDRSRKQMIEFSLSYLACNRGSQFNKKSYLRSLLRTMASHNNQSVVMLCQEIKNTTLKLLSNQKVKHDVLVVVNMELSSSSSFYSQTSHVDHLQASPEYSADFQLIAGENVLEKLTDRQLINVFDSALVANRDLLCDLLTKKKNDVSFLAFVCSLLPEASLYKILELQSKVDFKSICQYVDTIKLALCRSGFIKDDDNLKSIFWKTTLLFFLNRSSSSFDRKCLEKVVAQYIHSVKCCFDLTEKEILDRLTLSLPSLANTKSRKDLTAALKELGSKAQLLTSNEVGKVISQADCLDGVVNAIAQGDWGFSHQLWEELKESSRNRVKSALQRALLNKAARSKVILRLGREQQLEVIEILSVDAYKLVKPLWSDDITLQPASQSFEQSNQCGAVLKDFTLGYLVNERGSDFNRKSFARGLLKQLSSHYNISYCELLDNLYEGLNSGYIPLGINTILYEILDINVKPKQSVSVDKRARPEQGAALYFQLSQLLNSQASISSDNWNNSLQRLRSHYPTLLVRFIRELQQGIWNLNHIAEKLTEPSLKTLLNMVLVVTGHTDSNDGSVLELAINKFSSRSKSSFDFVLQSIHAVLAGDVIDLDQIERSLKKHSVSTDNDRNSPPANSHGMGSDIDEYLARSKVELPSKPSNEYAFSILTGVVGDEQALNRFLRFSESHQFSYYMALDAQKTRVLWPYVTLLRNTLLGTEFTFSPDIYNRWVCQSLVDQLLFPKLPPSVDRCIQLLLQYLYTHMTADSTTLSWAILKSQLLSRTFDLSNAINTPIDTQRTEIISKLLSSFSKVDITVAIPSDTDDAEPSKTIHTPMLFPKNSPLSNMPAASTAQFKPLDISLSVPSTDTGIAVSNAGIVAIAPYIPMLFEKLKLISNQTFIDDQSRIKAMAVLHYLTFSKPLYQAETFTGCGLTKLLCGLDVSEPVDEIVILDHNEQSVCEGLLQSVIGHWSALGQTTIEGLRETFFQRDGVMIFDCEKGWLLHVSPRSFDVLLDRLPWSYATVKYQFMKNVIHVEWR